MPLDNPPFRNRNQISLILKTAVSRYYSTLFTDESDLRKATDNTSVTESGLQLRRSGSQSFSAQHIWKAASCWHDKTAVLKV